MCTALFSLVDAVLLRPLPFPDQDSLYVIWKADPAAGSDYEELSYPELADLRDNVDAFESVALMSTTLYGYDQALQLTDTEPVRIETARVTSDFFGTLGVEPFVGRDFTESDNMRGAEPVVILSHWAWRQYFEADANVVGRQIRLSGDAYTVVGVIPDGVDFPRGAALWMPQYENARRAAAYLQAVARLKSGHTREQMQAQLNALFARTAQEHGAFYSPTQTGVTTPMPEYWTGASQRQLMLSLSASLLLLGAACVTAFNLFEARMLSRAQEFATRVALGASPRRLAGQLIGECVVVAAVACLGGLLLARSLIEGFVLWAPASIPRADQAGLNFYVLAFAICAASVAVVVAAAAPVWLTSRGDVERLLRESASRLTGGGWSVHFRGALMAAQSAIALVLLVGSLLLVVSVRNLSNQDLGFARDAITMNLTQRGLGAETDRFFTRLLEGLRESPGVSAAGAVLMRPLQGSIGWHTTYALASETGKRDEELPVANFEVVTPGYFAALGTHLLRGRDFSDGDDGESLPVAIINRSLADRLERGGVEPLGATIEVRTSGMLATVVGIVADARYRGVRERHDDIYVSYLQTRIPVRHLVIRGTLPPSELVGLVREQTLRLGSVQPPGQVETISEAASRATAADRFNMGLVLTFGVGALLLAAVGVYSVVSENVVQRRSEIAIRSALGAGRTALIRQLAAATIRSVLVGELVGLVAIVGLAPWLSTQLYLLDPTDPAVLMVVVAFLLALSAVAAALPSWAAVTARPTAILRGD